MKGSSKIKKIIMFSLFGIAIGLSIAYCILECIPKTKCQDWLVSLSTASTCAGLCVSFLPEYSNSCKTINKRGCFSIYNTIDCNSIVKKLEEEIKNGKKVIYQNCQGLNQTDIYNLKLKIHQHFSCSKIKDLLIGNVRYLDKFDIDDFNAQIFENHTRKKNIYIFDYLTTNEYFINMVQNRIQNSKNKKIKSTVIIYLSNHSVNVDNNEQTTRSKEINNELIDKKIDEIKEQNEEIHNVTTLYNLIANDGKLCNRLDETQSKKNKNYEIDKIVIKYYLIVGKYDKALEKIKMVLDIKKSLDENNPLDDYEFVYIVADAFHLTNRYSLALKLIGYYESSPMDKDLRKKYLKLKMHILKHQGKFDKSIQLVEDFNDNYDDDLKCKLLSIYMLQILNSKINEPTVNILNDNSNFLGLIEDFTPNDLDVLPRYNMYKAIIIASSNVGESMFLIDNCIEFFKKTDNRYIYNAYYVKAELLRYMNRFLEAYQYYLKSSGICNDHYDKNLLDQNYFSTRCLEKLGLVNGNLSERIKEYKEANDKSHTYGTNIDYISSFFNFEPDEEGEKDALLFNNQLLTLVDDKTFDPEKIKAILLKYLFIIL